MSRKIAIIGLDCAEPSLVFDRWLDDLPNLAGLVQRGLHGRLRSVDPPITVPAWSCMMSGRDPGELGVYGFRNRADHSYDRLRIADSTAIGHPRLWDHFGAAGRKSIVLGVPGTYPPPAVDGVLVADFMVPDTSVDQFTHPPELRDEVEQTVGGKYQVDVQNFRSEERDRILAEVYAMTEQRFELARHLLDTREWDLFAMVEIGLDRIQHAFWRFMDSAHRDFEPGHRYAEVIKSYYEYLDDEIGELLERFDDDTTVFVVSDHGGRAMEGAVCVNEWLIREGYLVLNTPAEPGTRISDADVDWSRTKAWGEGGYYCRLCVNVEGREPQGVVPAADYDAFRDELIAGLEALGDPDGNPIGTRVHRPEDLWAKRENVTPDLVVYFGNLGWRSAGTVGAGEVWTFVNDTGPDDANHAQRGLIMAAGPGIEPGANPDGMSLLDVTPTVLALAGLEAPQDLTGKSLATDAAAR